MWRSDAKIPIVLYQGYKVHQIYLDVKSVLVKMCVRLEKFFYTFSKIQVKFNLVNLMCEPRHYSVDKLYMTDFKINYSVWPLIDRVSINLFSDLWRAERNKSNRLAVQYSEFHFKKSGWRHTIRELAPSYGFWIRCTCSKQHYWELEKFEWKKDSPELWKIEFCERCVLSIVYIYKTIIPLSDFVIDFSYNL